MSTDGGATPPRRVHLHVGRLVLHGADPAQRELLQRQFHDELTRLLADPAIARNLGQGRHVARLHLPTGSAGGAPDTAGARAAATLVRGLQS